MNERTEREVHDASDMREGDPMDKCGCHVERLEKEISAEALRSASMSALAVSGMGCPNCALRVRNALLSLPGVYQAEVDLERARAMVHWDPSAVQPEKLIEAVSQAAQGTHHDYRAYFLKEEEEGLDGH